MFLTLNKVHELIKAFDAAKKTFHCNKERFDKEGKSVRTVIKAPKGKVKYTVEIPYGVHGSDFLEIDTETMKVRCAACAGTLNSVVEE